MSTPLKECNIILLGESGTGKSLFINSFANYAQYSSLNKAIEGKNPTTLISSKFVVTDSNDEDHEIEAGENDGNERTELGQSFTIKCLSYKFQLGDLTVRLIDTPGVNDTKGVGADVDNVANILSFINNFDNLHAIGIILKNSESKMTEKFTYCLQTLLTNLNKTAVNNIVFILSYCNGFKPGPVKTVIKLFIENELKESNLDLNKSIMYCFDNSSYEYLIATVNRGVQFDQRDLDIQNNSWKYSSQEMRRLITYIKELTPHNVKESTSLNDARHFIKVIHPFITEVLENINSNTTHIDKCQNDLQTNDENVKNVESDDTFKMDDIEIVPIELPITFCVSTKCRRVIKIGDVEKYHYPKQCCQGCRVSNFLRWWCEAIDWHGKCRECGCAGHEHDRKFFQTRITPSNMLTDEAVEKLKTAGSAKERLQIQIESLRQRKAQLLHEKSVFEDAEKKFVKFLQTNALIKPSERKNQGNDASVSAVLNVIERFDKEINSMDCISMEMFYQLKITLINLPINGIKLKQILEANERGMSSSFADKVTTILHNNVFSNYLSESMNSTSLVSSSNNSYYSNSRSLSSKRN